MTNRRSHLTLMALLLAALVGVGLMAFSGTPLHKEATLGLDLQGGLEVVLEAVPEEGTQLTDADLDRSVSIIRERIDKLGVSEPDVRQQGDDQIVIQLAGVFDQARAAEIIGKTAKLELYKLEANLIEPSRDFSGNIQPFTSLYDLLAGLQSQAKQGKASEWYLFGPKKRLLAGPSKTRKGLLATPEAKRALRGKKLADDGLPKGFKTFAAPPKTIVLTCGVTERYCAGVDQDPTQTHYYLLRFDPQNKENPVPEMTGEDLKLDGTRQDFDTTSGEAIVLMDFTDKGADKFHDVTRDIVISGRSKSLGGQTVLDSFAIVLDGVIKSSPTVDFNDNPDGIPGTNGAQITGIGDLQEAKDLALVLQTGALPIEFRTVERTDVSATLGKDSLNQAKNAAIAGLLIVALFLLVFYRFLGLVAVIGLGIYAAFMYAAILILGVTLTLPGFAGMILTIGVAADANVVVFERIKEESRTGKSVRAAIAAGYGKGFSTILDANAVTAITALVLFSVASASVKGFALMLLIGTVMSLVTAVAATRAMLGLLGGFRWFDSPRFMGAQGQQGAKWLQIDFMGKRYLWFALSGTVVALALFSLGLRGLNLGIDFEGGTQVSFRTPQPTLVEDVTKQVDRQNAVIQGRGGQVGEGRYRSFTIKTESLTPGEQDRLKGSLQTRYGENIAYGVKNVSESFGRQIASAAILAVLFSLFLIVIYVAIRYDFKYAFPIIVALLHDTVITIGIYALTGSEVSTATVAAVLTVLGYSIYDTIIIFDRVRENVHLMRRSPFAHIANVSLWETIRRSLATTFITLLPITSLLLFGGDTLKDFAFALLVGIGSGAYSSIFIAAPLLTMWKEREPEYARRLTSDPEAKGGGEKALEPAVSAAAAEPAPAIAPLPEGDGKASSAAAKRERRRQRRKARPHGRAR